MDLVAILIYFKRYGFYILLSVTIVWLLGFILYILSRDVFGVHKFKKQFNIIFKPIRKKQRKNIEIKSSETSNTILEIKKLHIIHEKILVSIDNAQNVKDKQKDRLRIKLDLSHKKFLRFEQYVLKYHEQITTYYNIESVPIRVSDKLKEYEDVWK